MGLNDQEHNELNQLVQKQNQGTINDQERQRLNELKNKEGQ